MKTEEHLNHKYAHGPVNLYDIYLEGYQDCKKDNEDNFRREIAMKMLSVTATMKITKDSATVRIISKEGAAKLAIEYADELIRQLKEDKK